jgi:hypothetical protein
MNSNTTQAPSEAAALERDRPVLPQGSPRQATRGGRQGPPRVTVPIRATAPDHGHVGNEIPVAECPSGRGWREVLRLEAVCLRQQRGRDYGSYRGGDEDRPVGAGQPPTAPPENDRARDADGDRPLRYPMIGGKDGRATLQSRKNAMRPSTISNERPPARDKHQRDYERGHVQNGSFGTSTDRARTLCMERGNHGRNHSCLYCQPDQPIRHGGNMLRSRHH